jgi:hypothetical protein
MSALVFIHRSHQSPIQEIADHGLAFDPPNTKFFDTRFEVTEACLGDWTAKWRFFIIGLKTIGSFLALSFEMVMNG